MKYVVETVKRSYRFYEDGKWSKIESINNNTGQKVLLKTIDEKPCKDFEKGEAVFF